MGEDFVVWGGMESFESAAIALVWWVEVYSYHQMNVTF